MTDDPDTAELENRIDKLESTIEKMMPSRRDALKMGGAALIGGAAMSGTFVACVNGKTGTSERFTDLGVSVRGTNGFDIAGSNDAGGAQTRNYDGLTDLDLAMSSGTYEVTVFGVVLETA